MTYIDERVDEWRLNHSDSDYEDWKIKRELRQQNEIKMTQIVKNYRLQQRRDEEARIAEALIEEKTRIAKKKTKTFVCRRCSEKYPSNTKLHEHVRTKHCKKPKKSTPPASPPTTPTAPAFLPTTPKKPISWAEIASRPKKPNIPSRLPRLTTKYGLSTPPPSPHLLPILQPHKATNSMTKRPSITRFKTPYLTMQNLYTKFHEKPKPSSFPTMQNSLHSASTSGMHTRQMRITAYFKPTANRTINGLKPSPPASRFMVNTLNFNRKHAQLNIHDIWTRFDHLAPTRSLARHSITHRTCRHCKQHFSSGNFLHRHLTHCSRGIFGFKHAWRTHDHNSSMFTPTPSH